MKIADIMALAPVIPVLVIDDAANAHAIADALVGGGLFALEVTLRTPAALEVIRAMSEIPGAVVGAGTVLNARDLDAAQEAGARFIVSPGFTANIAGAAVAADIPLLPGVATAGDIMRGLDAGLSHFKFFPAVASGGIPALRALTGPFGSLRFCPTGGVTQSTMHDWLAVPGVICVGGSWMVPSGPVDTAAIRASARLAATRG